LCQPDKGEIVTPSSWVTCVDCWSSIPTRGEEAVVWIQASALWEKVAKLMGQPIEKMDDAQWIGHILKRLHLLDEAGRKRGIDGILSGIRPFEVLDMMRRYDVELVNETR
jgi:hypothetical protein